MLITLHLWPSIAMRSADRTHIHKLGEGIIVLPGISVIGGQIFVFAREYFEETGTRFP